MLNPAKDLGLFKFNKDKKQSKKDTKTFKDCDFNVIGRLYLETNDPKLYRVVWNSTAIQKIQCYIDHQGALAGHKRYKVSKACKAQIRWDVMKSWPESEKQDYGFEDADNLECCEEETKEESEEDYVFDNSELEKMEKMVNVNWETDEPSMPMPMPKYNRNASTTVNDADLFRNVSALQAFLRYSPLAFWKQVSYMSCNATLAYGL